MNQTGDGDRARLICVIHTEEEFDWNAPFSPKNRSVSHLKELDRIQDLFENLNVKPVYVCDYTVTESDRACEKLSDYAKKSRAHVGAHLHPWINPPYEEPINARNSFPCNLTQELERKKLEQLTQVIDERIGLRPQIYLAGRYGADVSSLNTALQLGYKVDLSLAPTYNFSASFGPNFSQWINCTPFWHGGVGSLYCIPVTASAFGLIGGKDWAISRYAYRLQQNPIFPFAYLLQKLRLLEKSRLTPEGVSLTSMAALTKALFKRGQRVFTLHVHSPSFGINHTKYAKTREERDALVERLRAYIRFFTDEFAGQASDPIRERKLAIARGESFEDSGAPIGKARPNDPPRIALVSWHFPPANAIAAVRIGKMAKHMIQRGFDIRIITARRKMEDGSLPVEIPESKIIRTEYHDLDAQLNPLPFLRAIKKMSSEVLPKFGTESKSTDKKGVDTWFKNKVRLLASRLYNNIILFPDSYKGWRPAIYLTLEQMSHQWSPDIIFVSVPPYSTLKPSALFAKRQNIPWVAEFRDLWSGEKFPVKPIWRPFLDSIAESLTVSSASQIVTVSEPWQQYFAKRYGVPVHSIMNGYDRDEFADIVENTSIEETPNGPLVIHYAGALYNMRRDPTPLFRALIVGEFRPEDIALRFRTHEYEFVSELAKREQVSGYVTALPTIPYDEALREQRRADIQLLLQWNDPRNSGNVPAKLFEQIALRRPILGLGPLNGVPARIIEEKKAGYFANDPEAIAEKLSQWLRVKRDRGVIPDLPVSVIEGLDRSKQYDLLCDQLFSVISKSRPGIKR